MDQKQIHQQPESWSGYSKIPGSGSRHIDSDPKCWVTANKNYWYRYCTVCKIAFQLVKTDTCKQPRNTCFYGMVLTTRMTCNSMPTPVRLWSATCILAQEAVSHHSTAYNTVYHINNKCVLKSQHAIDIPVMRNWYNFTARGTRYFDSDSGSAFFVRSDSFWEGKAGKSCSTVKKSQNGLYRRLINMSPKYRYWSNLLTWKVSISGD
jgi:hypothetical protein